MANAPPHDATLVVRAAGTSRQFLRRQRRLALGVFAGVELLNVAVFAVNAIRVPRLRLPGLIYVLGVTAVAVLVGVFIRRRVLAQMFLFAAPDRVGFGGLRGDTRVVARADLRSVRRVSVLAFSRARAAQLRGRLLLFLGDGDVCLLRVRAENFADADVERFLDGADVAVTGSWDDLDTAKQLRRRFPRSVPWAQAHVILLTMSLCVLVSGVAVVTALLVGRHG